jgi:hypothetical protein
MEAMYHKYEKIEAKKKGYFVKHCKQEMHDFDREHAECDGWEEGDMIDKDNWKGEYHEVMFGPFDKTKAELIFKEIKNIKNLHYSITQGEWEETSSIHGKKGFKRTTGSNYHNEGYYYEYLSIENPLEQATNMSVDIWLEKMDMSKCLETGSDSEDESSDIEDDCLCVSTPDRGPENSMKYKLNNRFIAFVTDDDESDSE